MALSLSLSQAAVVTLTVGAGSGSPGSTENPVVMSLDNQNDEITGIQVDICDVDDYLTCTGCDTTERTSGFSCSTEELDSGCCRIILFDLSGYSIAEGTGPAFTIQYDISEGAPGDECRDLDPEEVKVLGEDGEIPSENVTAESGRFCFNGSVTTSTTTAKPP